jgi:hypothetical protein
MVESEHARSRAEAALKRKEDARAEGLKAKDLSRTGMRHKGKKLERPLKLCRAEQNVWRPR